MDLQLTIEDARELQRTLHAHIAVFRDDDSPGAKERRERLEAIARRIERLLTTPVLHHDPFV